MMKMSACRSSRMLLLLRAASMVGASALPAEPVTNLARAIYELSSPPQIVVYATGGGINLASYLLTTPGSSRCVLDVQMPYSRPSLTQVIGHEPTKYCSPAVAHDLAAAAFKRARSLQEANGPAVGVGCTAALRSEPLRRGAHRCFVAICTEGGTHELALTLAKGARSRQLEDAVVSRVALVGLARACGVELSAQQSDMWRLEPDAEGKSVENEKLVASFTPASGV